MIARWDVLLLAAILSGGSMLIENSHRVDTGASDDAFATAPASECADDSAARRSDRTTDVDAGFAISAATDDVALAACD